MMRNHCSLERSASDFTKSQGVAVARNSVALRLKATVVLSTTPFEAALGSLQPPQGACASSIGCVVRAPPECYESYEELWGYRPPVRLFELPPDGEQQVEEVEERAMSPAQPTTLMLRNIACRYTETDVQNILDAMGFKSAYDAIYVPYGKQRGMKKSTKFSNFGYAFVNFKGTDEAEACRHRLASKVFGKAYGFGHGSSKICEVGFAAEQGLENLMRRRDRV